MNQGLSLSEQVPQEARNAWERYLAELEKTYPGGASHCQVIPWSEYGEGSYVVKVPMPDEETLWMKISEHMADIATHILVESDQLFILTA
jgi:hypothetical protein